MLSRLCVCVLLAGFGLATAPVRAEPGPAPAGEDPAPVVAAPHPGSPEGMGPGSPSPTGIAAHEPKLDDDDRLRVALWRAWSQPGPLPERVRRVQRAGLAGGVGSLDAPARALLLEPEFGDALERAELAVELAPGLPAAHAALAAARFEHRQFDGAWDALREALAAAPHHLEARLWLEATALDVLFGACLGTAFAFLALSAFAAFPRFAHALHRVREVPAPSAGALALAGVLLPVALGEGLAGLGLGLLAFALVNGSAWRRLWVMSAAALMLLALFPVLELRARSRAALVLDPVALAAWTTEQGTPSATELARVTHAAATDPLAARALALRLARRGELAEAERRFTELLEQDGSPELVANLAAVRLLRGKVESSIELYEKAAKLSDSALVRFNLAQAYGRAIRLDAQEVALEEAQSIDPEVLTHVNHRYDGQDGALVAYLPLSAADVMARIRDAGATAFLARSERRRIAPGVLGETRGDAVVALWLAAGAGLLLGAVLRRLAGPEEDLYAGIARLLQARGDDSVERMAQLTELRRRQHRAESAAFLAAWLVPGAAGMVAKRPLLALLSVAVFVTGCSIWLHRHGAIPDPLALGPLPEALISLGLAGLGLAYLVLLLTSLALREKR